MIAISRGILLLFTPLRKFIAWIFHDPFFGWAGTPFCDFIWNGTYPTLIERELLSEFVLLSLRFLLFMIFIPSLGFNRKKKSFSILGWFDLWILRLESLISYSMLDSYNSALLLERKNTFSIPIISFINSYISSFPYLLAIVKLELDSVVISDCYWYCIMEFWTLICISLPSEYNR